MAVCEEHEPYQRGGDSHGRLEGTPSLRDDAPSEESCRRAGSGTKRSVLDAALDWLPDFPAWVRRTARRLLPEPACESEHKVLLVVGECGDGKSTLINALRDPKRSGQAEAGLHSRGITKEITAYVGKPINRVPIDYLDTPGVGDTDVTPMKVLTMIEQELMTDELGGHDSIDGVIVTTPIPDGRVKLGAQVVQLLVEHGFLGEEKWRNIILVGTKADRATQEELELFRTDRRDVQGHPVGVAAQFFSAAPGGRGTCVTTALNNYDELRKAIAALPNAKVKYATPDPTFMAEKFSDKLGVSKDVFRAELVQARKEFEAKLAEQLEDRKQLEDQVQQLRLAQEASRQQQVLLQEVKAQQLKEREQERDRLMAELRSASGPAERAKLEAEKARLESRLQQEKEDHLAQQNDLQSKLEQSKREMESLRVELQQTKRRNYSFAEQMGGAGSHCPPHRNTRKWGNAHGRGRKCVDCGQELEYKR